MKVENNGKTLSGTAKEMKLEFYRQVKADEFQNDYWQWKFYSNFSNQFESLTNKKHPVFDENTKYRCEMTEKHPKYAVLNRKPAEAGKSKLVAYEWGGVKWLTMLVCVCGKYYLINPRTMDWIANQPYNTGQEIENGYECTPEEIQQIKDSLFNS